MKRPRVLFASWHFYMDNSNGASISARELLLGLHGRGWDVKTLCGPLVDNPASSNVCNVLQLRRIQAKTEISENNDPAFTVSSFNDSGIQSVVFCPSQNAYVPQRSVGELFLTLFASSLVTVKPDLVLTYGGSWLTSSLLHIAKKAGVKTLFLLQNLAYKDKRLFEHVDMIVVPSRFASTVYKQRLGIETVPIPPLIRKEIVSFDELTTRNARKYALFVNPCISKGVCFFAAIARELWKIRPDIPFLVVDGSATSDKLSSCGVDLKGVKNISVMANTTRPLNFFRYAKLTLVPSLVEETFGRVAAESIIAGVPVISSTRGALPETLESVGTLLNIASKFQSDTKIVPTFTDVKPWLDEIVRLWDDSDYYVERRRLGLACAKRWDYSDVLDRYAACMTRLLSPN